MYARLSPIWARTTSDSLTTAAITVVPIPRYSSFPEANWCTSALAFTTASNSRFFFSSELASEERGRRSCRISCTASRLATSPSRFPPMPSAATATSDPKSVLNNSTASSLCGRTFPLSVRHAVSMPATPFSTPPTLLLQLSGCLQHRDPLGRQLAAGRIDVAPVFPADGRVDPVGLQDSLKTQDLLPRSPLKVSLRHEIDGNQIDQTFHPREQLSQLVGMLLPVVSTADQGVFEGDAPPCKLQIIPTSIHQFGQRISAVDRHQFGPELIVRGMQG